MESKVSFYKKKHPKWVSFHTKKRIHKPRHKRSSKDFKVGAELSGFNSSRLKVLVTRRALVYCQVGYEVSNSWVQKWIP